MNNNFKYVARAEKANRWAVYLQQAGYSAADVAAFSSEEWRERSEHSGIKVPHSRATVDLIVKIMSPATAEPKW